MRSFTFIPGTHVNWADHEEERLLRAKAKVELQAYLKRWRRRFKATGIAKRELVAMVETMAHAQGWVGE